MRMRTLLFALVLLGTQASPGRVLSGRVLTADGKPVAQATILLLAPAESKDAPRKQLLETRSGADGRFELRGAPETRGELLVRGECAGVKLVALEAGKDARALGDLTLQGPGALAGRATFVDGHPAPDIELWAVPEDVALQPNALVLCVEQALEHELAGQGLFSTRARTDADGRFRLAGLREGRYMLRCPRAAVVLEPRSGYYQATTENIALAVESARLRVRALDPQGRELVGARVRLTELNEAGGGRYQPGQVWNETIGGPLACASFDVQPESAYGVRVEAKGFAAREDLVLLAQNEYEQLHEYRLEPPAAPGRVRLVLKPVAGFAPGDVLVDLVSPLYGAPDPDAEPLKLDAQGWLPPLAPGRYFFALRFRDAADAPNWYLPFETRELLELASKAEKELALELRAGARIELDLTGPPLADAEVSAEGLEGQPSCKLRFSAGAKGSDLLPIGRYRIRARAPKFAEASAEIVLEPGKFTKLALTLRAR
jgi:hypothetical protein